MTIQQVTQTPASPNPFDAENSLAGAPPNIPVNAPSVPNTPPAIGNVSANAAPPAPTAPQKPNVIRRVGQKVASGIENLGDAANPTYQASPDGSTLARIPSRSLFKGILSSALAALSGAGAGEQAIQNNRLSSPAGNFLTGINAGMANQANTTAAARQQAQEDFERQQKALVQKAQIAHANIATMKEYFDLKNQGIAEDTERNKSIGNVFEDAGYSTKVVDTNDLQALRAKDAHFLTNNLVLPLGWAPVSGPDGAPIFNTDGTPREAHQVLVINVNNGVDSATGKIFLPPEMVAEIQDHGDRAGMTGAKFFTDDTEVSAGQFADLLRTLKTYNSSVSKGWQWAAQNLDKTLAVQDGKPVIINPVSGEPRPWEGPIPEGVQAKIDAVNALAKQRKSVGAKNDALAKNGGKAPAKPRATDPYTSARRYIGDQISQTKTNLAQANKSVDLDGQKTANARLADLQTAQTVVDLFASKKYGSDQEKKFVDSSKSLTPAQKQIINAALGLE